MENSLYQEAIQLARMYDIPEIIVDDYYEAFVEFVREEVNKRIKTGMSTKINPDIFMMVIMAEANI